MKPKSIFLLLLLCIPVCAMAQKGIIESYRPAVPPVIDGKMSDWESDWLLDPKGKFAYNIANDDENLYYRIKIVDDLTQHKVGLFGLNVLLNPAGKKIGKKGIKFPMGKDESELNRKPKEDEEKQQGPPTAARLIEMNQELIKDSEALEIIGLSKTGIVSSRLGLMNGMQMIILADSAGDYIYEGKIPFKSLKIKKSEVKILGVAFQTGKMAHAAPKVAPGNTSSGFGQQNQGAYGRGGYGGGYGGGGYGQQRSQVSYQPYNVWQVATGMSVGVILK